MSLVNENKSEIKKILDKHHLDAPKILGTSDMLEYVESPWIDLIVSFKLPCILYSLSEVESELTDLLNVTVSLTRVDNLNSSDREIIEKNLIEI